MPIGDLSINKIDIRHAGKVIDLVMTIPPKEDQIIAVAEIRMIVYGPIGVLPIDDIELRIDEKYRYAQDVILGYLKPYLRAITHAVPDGPTYFPPCERAQDISDLLTMFRRSI